MKQRAPDSSVRQTPSSISSAGLARYRRPRLSRSVAQLAGSACAFGLAWWLAYACLRDAPCVAALFAVVAAGFLVRLFVIQHDCGHGSFFESRMANDALGAAIGVLTLTPYLCWRRYHAAHHAGSGNLDRRGHGDIRMLTVDEYVRLGPAARLGYRLYRHPIILFGVGPFLQFVVRQRFAYYVPRSWRKERRSVYQTNLALLAAALLGRWATGGWSFLLLHALILALASSAGVWLFYVQHQFDGTYWRHQDSWEREAAALEGSSYYELPPVLQWLTGSIGLHHVHHLDSRIPNYRLRECLDENPALQQPRRLTLAESVRCASLKLWDEKQGRMVGFEALWRQPGGAT